jgi:hypothetical protein
MTDEEKVTAEVQKRWPMLLAWAHGRRRWPQQLPFEVPDFGVVWLAVSADGARIEVTAAERGAYIMEMRPHG